MRRLWILAALLPLGCAPERVPPPDPRPTPAPTPATREPEKTSSTTPLEAQWAVNPYVIGEPVSGRIVGLRQGEDLGSVSLHIASKKEWDLAQSQGRPAIPAETLELGLTDPEGTPFQFNQSPELVGPLMVWATRSGRVSLKPQLVLPRGGGPPDMAGEVDGVTFPPGPGASPTRTTPDGVVIPD